MTEIILQENYVLYFPKRILEAFFFFYFFLETEYYKVDEYEYILYKTTLTYIYISQTLT